MNKIPERPGFNESVRNKLSVLVAKDISSCDNRSSKDITAECYDVFDTAYICRENGYELAKRFEDDHGYDPDLHLVETLDCASSHYDDLIKQQTKEWVLAYDVKLYLPVGAKVIIDSPRKNTEGEITKHYPETGQYLVWTPDMGIEKKGVRGYVMNYEKVWSVEIEAMNKSI